MKIDHKIQLGATMLESGQKGGSGRTARDVSPEKAGREAFSVSISKTAGNLAKASELMAKSTTAEDEVRRERVIAIKEQLAAGTYNISGRDVAAKILNSLKG